MKPEVGGGGDGEEVDDGNPGAELQVVTSAQEPKLVELEEKEEDGKAVHV